MSVHLVGWDFLGGRVMCIGRKVLRGKGLGFVLLMWLVFGMPLDFESDSLTVRERARERASFRSVKIR